MSTNQRVFLQKLGMVASATVGLFGLGFAIWIFYATLVEYTSDGEFTFMSALAYGILAIQGVGSVLLGHLVWRRISGDSFSTGAVYFLAAAIAFLWVPMFFMTPSPSMFVYVLVAGALLILHELFGRQRSKSAATFSESTRQSWAHQTNPNQD
jgi:hypothetical protein